MPDKKQATVKKDDSLANADLLETAKKGDVAGVKRALKDGAEVEAHDVLLETPLIAAAKRGHLAVVETLLAAEADPNAKSRPAVRSMTALMWSAENGFEEIVRLLVKSGADVSARNSEDKTACELAEAHNHRSIVNLLSPNKKA